MLCLNYLNDIKQRKDHLNMASSTMYLVNSFHQPILPLYDIRASNKCHENTQIEAICPAM